ncbi:MAG TPA: hypothetical protein VIW71_18095 [Streptomyces sp.]
MSVDGQSLVAIRDTMTSLSPDERTEQALTAILAGWRGDRASVDPIGAIRDVLDDIRALPRGAGRLAAMNTFVRTLGEAEALATFLDMMRDSAERPGTADEELTRFSRNARKHAVYGWAGQTLLLFSGFEPTEATVTPEPGVLELMGENPPAAVWGLSMHIWQPNPNAKGFSSGARIEEGVIVEPPHSHPFDFASMVSTGVMRQSIYAQASATPGCEGRYDGVRLEHVDGVWPEHQYRATCELSTLEKSVELTAGDSYYLPCDVIHDVEFDAKVATATPAVSLFLCSEAVVKPHVYMAATMADAHDANPALKAQGGALTPEAWQAKLAAVSAYLRGQRSTLSLDDIVDYDGEYAFFHSA